MGPTSGVFTWIPANNGRRGWRRLRPMRDPSDPARRQAMAVFLAECGWGGVRPAPLAGDASFRRYYRLGDNGRRAVLMDAPPPQEDVVPYITVSRLLRRLGFSAPEVYAEDRAGGFLL